MQRLAGDRGFIKALGIRLGAKRMFTSPGSALQLLTILWQQTCNPEATSLNLHRPL